MPNITVTIVSYYNTFRVNLTTSYLGDPYAADWQLVFSNDFITVCVGISLNELSAVFFVKNTNIEAS